MARTVLGTKQISIHSAIASGDFCHPVSPHYFEISIHSAIASGDDFWNDFLKPLGISIHSAIASGDPTDLTHAGIVSVFQSTPPSLAETLAGPKPAREDKDFNPLRHR